MDTLRHTLRPAIATAGVALLVGTAHAAPILVDFETNPSIAAGPSTYLAAGPTQTINVPGVATFSGGVILGNATNFPAIVFASKPNSYSTASPNVAQGDPSLSSVIDIAVDPSLACNEVSLALFNGNTMPVDYMVSAFNGTTLLGSQTFNAVPSNLNQGFVTPDLVFAGITDVKVTLVNPANGWDFLIDDVVFNGNIVKVVPGATPEPASLAVLGLGVVGIIRRRKAAK
jgi:hypothetical protein